MPAIRHFSKIRIVNHSTASEEAGNLAMAGANRNPPHRHRQGPATLRIPQGLLDWAWPVQAPGPVPSSMPAAGMRASRGLLPGRRDRVDICMIQVHRGRCAWGHSLCTAGSRRLAGDNSRLYPIPVPCIPSVMAGFLLLRPASACVQEKGRRQWKPAGLRSIKLSLICSVHFGFYTLEVSPHTETQGGKPCTNISLKSLHSNSLGNP